MKCSVKGCETEEKHKGLCGKHYKRQWRHGNPETTMIVMHQGERCIIKDCGRFASSRDLCKMHNTRRLRYGRTNLIRAPNGEGGLNCAGYKVITINHKRQYEHILIAERALGKPLPKGAVIHHVNGNPSDNRPSNLVVCPSQAYHMLLHYRTVQYELNRVEI